jgi:hypothetical protein
MGENLEVVPEPIAEIDEVSRVTGRHTVRGDISGIYGVATAKSERYPGPAPARFRLRCTLPAAKRGDSASCTPRQSRLPTPGKTIRRGL